MPAFLFMGPSNMFLLGAAPLLAMFDVTALRWVSQAFGNLGVRLALVEVMRLESYDVHLNLTSLFRPNLSICPTLHVSLRKLSRN
jgi:hypothetical protein